MSEIAERFRVARTPGALYGELRVGRKRRRCDGHMADPHWIEPGELVTWSALPPDHPDIGNDRWWHSVFCADCAPTATTNPAPTAGRDESEA